MEGGLSSCMGQREKRWASASVPIVKGQARASGSGRACDVDEGPQRREMSSESHWMTKVPMNIVLGVRRVC